MNSMYQRIAEIALILVIFICLIIILVPWPAREINIEIEQDKSIYNNNPDKEDDMTLQVLPEKEISLLFGWQPYILPKEEYSLPEVVPPETAMEAGWLLYLGFYNDKFLFKDTTSNCVLALAIGEKDRGWTLLGKNDNQFNFDYEGKKYFVIKKD
jgi:hypothetical protein